MSGPVGVFPTVFKQTSSILHPSGVSQPLEHPIHIPHNWFHASIIVFCEVSGVRFFLAEPLWDVVNSWITNLKKMET